MIRQVVTLLACTHSEQRSGYTHKVSCIDNLIVDGNGAIDGEALRLLGDYLSALGGGNSLGL